MSEFKILHFYRQFTLVLFVQISIYINYLKTFANDL